MPVSAAALGSVTLYRMRPAFVEARFDRGVTLTRSTKVDRGQLGSKTGEGVPLGAGRPDPPSSEWGTVSESRRRNRRLPRSLEAIRFVYRS